MSNTLISFQTCTKIKILWVTWFILPERTSLYSMLYLRKSSFIVFFLLFVRWMGVCWHACKCVLFFLSFFRLVLGSKINNNFSIFLSSLSERNLSLGLSLLVTDYSGRQRKLLPALSRRERGGGGSNTNIWQCTDLNPQYPVMKLDSVFFSMGNDLRSVQPTKRLSWA